MKRIVLFALLVMSVIVFAVFLPSHSTQGPTSRRAVPTSRITNLTDTVHPSDSAGDSAAHAAQTKSITHSSAASSRPVAVCAVSGTSPERAMDSSPTFVDADNAPPDTGTTRTMPAPDRRPPASTLRARRNNSLPSDPDAGGSSQAVSIDTNASARSWVDDPGSVFGDGSYLPAPDSNAPEPNMGTENEVDESSGQPGNGEGNVVSQVTREFILSGVLKDDTTSVTDLRQWRGTLLDAADADPNSPWAAEAFFQAAKISGVLGEREKRMRYLEAGVTHPRVEPTAKMLALEELAGLEGSTADGIGRAFEHLNEACEIVKGLPPELRQQWEFKRTYVVFRKALMLDLLAAKGVIHPELSGPDAGRTASDYTQMLLDMPEERLEAAGLSTHRSKWLIYQARQFLREGKREQAAQNYHEVLQDPERTQPRTYIAYLEATARYEPDSLELAKALEHIEQSLPPDKWSGTLWFMTSHAYWVAGAPERYISRVRPLLDSEDPADQAFLSEHPHGHADLLYQIAESYEQLDPPDLSQALAFYERLLAEYPDYFAAESVWQQVDALRERLARRESDNIGHPPTSNEEKNK